MMIGLTDFEREHSYEHCIECKNVSLCDMQGVCPECRHEEKQRREIARLKSNVPTFVEWRPIKFYREDIEYPYHAEVRAFAHSRHV